MVNIMTRSLEKNPNYPLNRRKGGPQGQYGRFGEGKNLFPLPDRPARNAVTILTELRKLVAGKKSNKKHGYKQEMTEEETNV
jgi:hypothetical protein